MSARLPPLPDRLRRTSAADLVLAGCVLTQLVVLLALPRVVTVDGPAHVAGGWVLAQLSDPLLGQWFRLDVSALPNVLSTVLLAALVPLLGPDSGEKALVAAYVVLLPAGLRYALRGVHPDAGWAALLAVPLTWNYLLAYGFYNFCLALALGLFAVGVALRRRDGWSPRSVVVLALLLLVTWSAHLLPVLVAGLATALLGAARAGAARRQGVRLAAAARRHVLPVVLAGVPVLVLTGVFLASPAAAHGPPVRSPLAQLLLGYVTTGGPLVVYTPTEYVPAAAVSAVLVAIAVASVRSRAPWTPERAALALTFVAVSVAYVVSPAQYGGEYGFLNDRWSFFPPLFLVLAAAGPPPGRWLRRAAPVVLVVATLALVALRLPTELRYQRDVAELVSIAPTVPRGTALLHVQLWRDPPVGRDARNPFRDPLRHATGRLAVQTHGVDTTLYEASLPYFPVRFRADHDLRLLLGPAAVGVEVVPPSVDLARASRLVEVVVLVGRPQAGPSPATAPLLAQLEAGYLRVAVSSRSGLAEVWVRRAAPS